MARVSSFQFASDSTYADPTVCTIDWAAETISYIGGANIPFSVCDELVQVISDLAGQDESDGVIETAKAIVGGPTVTYQHTVTPRTITPGASPFPAAKAQDLADGIATFVLAELA